MQMLRKGMGDLFVDPFQAADFEESLAAGKAKHKAGCGSME